MLNKNISSGFCKIYAAYLMILQCFATSSWWSTLKNHQIYGYKCLEQNMKKGPVIILMPLALGLDPISSLIVARNMKSTNI